MELVESSGQGFFHHDFLPGFGFLFFLNQAFSQRLTYCFSLTLNKYPQSVNG